MSLGGGEAAGTPVPWAPGPAPRSRPLQQQHKPQRAQTGATTPQPTSPLPSAAGDPQQLCFVFPCFWMCPHACPCADPLIPSASKAASLAPRAKHQLGLHPAGTGPTVCPAHTISPRLYWQWGGGSTQRAIPGSPSVPREDHRITECSGLEGTSVGHSVQPLCRSRVTQSRLHKF